MPWPRCSGSPPTISATRPHGVITIVLSSSEARICTGTPVSVISPFGSGVGVGVGVGAGVGVTVGVGVGGGAVGVATGVTVASRGAEATGDEDEQAARRRKNAAPAAATRTGDNLPVRPFDPVVRKNLPELGNSTAGWRRLNFTSIPSEGLTMRKSSSTLLALALIAAKPLAFAL